MCGSTSSRRNGSLPRLERLRRRLLGVLLLVLFVLRNLDLASARRFTKALRPSRSTQTTLTQDPRTIYEQYDPSHPCSCPCLSVFPMLRLRHSSYYHSHFNHPILSAVESVQYVFLQCVAFISLTTEPSPNLAFLTSVLSPQQKRATYGLQHATSFPSYSSHGKLWTSTLAQERTMLSLRTLPPLSGFG